MKIAKSRLKQIIREELQRVREQEEGLAAVRTLPISPGLSAILAVKKVDELENAKQIINIMRGSMIDLEKAKEEISEEAIEEIRIPLPVAGASDAAKIGGKLAKIGKALSAVDWKTAAKIGTIALAGVAAGTAVYRVVANKALLDKSNDLYHKQNMSALEAATDAARRGCEIDVKVNQGLKDELSGKVNWEAEAEKTASGKVASGLRGEAHLIITKCREPEGPDDIDMEPSNAELV